MGYLTMKIDGVAHVCFGVIANKILYIYDNPKTSELPSH